MTKAELIQSITQEANITKDQAEQALDAIWKTIESFLVEKESLLLVGFGTFKISKRKERQGRNPRTQEIINIPETVVPVFVAGKALKEVVNQKK